MSRARTPFTGPFGVFGLVAGLLAGSLFLPSGCGLTADESLRLRVGLPLLGPVVFLLAALVAAQLLRSRLIDRAARGWRDRTIPGSVAVVLIGIAAFALGTVLLYSGARVFDDGGLAEGAQLLYVALVILLPVVAPAIVALPLVVCASRLASEAPVGSSVATAARRLRWSLIAAAAHTSVATVLGVRMASSSPFDPVLFTAAAVVCVVLLAVSVRVTLRMAAESFERASARRSIGLLRTPYRSPADIGEHGASEARQRRRIERTSLAAFAVSLTALIALVPILRRPG